MPFHPKAHSFATTNGHNRSNGHSCDDCGPASAVMKAFLASKAKEGPGFNAVQQSLTALLRSHKQIKADEGMTFELLTGMLYCKSGWGGADSCYVANGQWWLFLRRDHQCDFPLPRGQGK